MIKRKKILFSFVNIYSIIILLSFFIAKVKADTKIIAKNGDTLFKLSREYGVPLKELMYKNNYNDANKIVEGEVIIIPRKNYSENNDKELLTHKVIEGDTLYKISRDYNVKLNDIISINKLDNSSLLKPNQIIVLPKGAFYKKVIAKKSIKSAIKRVSYHQTSKIESLSEIALIHKVKIEEIITLNKLNDPIKVAANTKLKIRNRKTLKWLKYGSITINWSDWRYLDGNYITKAKNTKNLSFYLSVNCEKRALNNTLKDSSWSSWYFPTSDFEFKLINDFCDQAFKI